MAEALATSQEFTITRVFGAPREIVFGVFSEPIPPERIVLTWGDPKTEELIDSLEIYLKQTI